MSRALSKQKTLTKSSAGGKRKSTIHMKQCNCDTQAKVSVLCIGHEKRYVYTEHLRRLSDSFLLRRSMSELEIPHVLVTGHRQSFVCRYAFELARSDQHSSHCNLIPARLPMTEKRPRISQERVFGELLESQAPRWQIIRDERLCVFFLAIA